MGRDYVEELSNLDATRRWAAALELPGELATQHLGCNAAFIVASGGSVAAAQYLSDCYVRQFGKVATVMTPLELLGIDRLESIDVWLLSAGGNNADILTAFDACVVRRAASVSVICAQPSSPLANAARSQPSSMLIDFELPTGKDGFLATNSLIAFVVVIARLFGDDSAKFPPVRLPTQFGTSLPDRTLLVLYDPVLKAAALDIESRFSEAALGHVLICDLRNFAHGRHVWLAKRGATSTVLALSSPPAHELAEATLSLLPEDVERHHWAFASTDANSLLNGMTASMDLARHAGLSIGIDPGRPGVPAFGSSIYNLGPKGYSTRRSWRERAIESKAGKSLRRLDREGSRLDYESGLTRFVENISAASVGAIVTDYDGTLVHTRDRFGPVSEQVAAELVRLLDDGMLLGIATGRGKSVHATLAKCIPERLWERVLVGYYNGGEVRSLADGCDRLADGRLLPQLERVHATLVHDPHVKDWKIEPRPTQVTVLSGQAGLCERELWLRVAEVVARGGHHDVKIMHSTHSVDIVPVQMSKVRVVEMLKERTNESCIQIGDRGRWPGNDAELLALPNSLSVDEVSPHLATCWNLVPHGLIGSEAATWYLKCLRNGHFFVAST